MQETTFIEQIVEDESQMEGIPPGCSKILNWHLHLDACGLAYPKGWILQKNLDVVQPVMWLNFNPKNFMPKPLIGMIFNWTLCTLVVSIFRYQPLKLIQASNLNNEKQEPQISWLFWSFGRRKKGKMQFIDQYNHLMVSIFAYLSLGNWNPA